jgi:nucleotide-binding universal stress UspA family protein
VALTSRIVHGSPVWELANACAPDDILVVGTHKTGFLQGRVLGSRSVSLAGTAPCAVVVVPVGRLNSRHGVVAGVVRADGMELAVAAAAREAARLREPLTLLHASPPRPDGAARDHDHDHESAQRALLRDAAAAAHAVAPGVEIHTRISGRKPVEALLDASRYATMLVLEPSRRTGPAVSMVGTTTHDVLMNINSPVLVARGTAV